MTLDPKAFKSLARLLAPSAGGLVADRALAEKLIVQGDLDDCLRDQETSGKPIDEILVQRGLLSAALVERLRRFSLPPEAAAAAADPRRVVRQYVLVSLLGRGGMAEVWKSWDRALERWVAIKLLKSDVGHAATRIEREGRTAGGLSHPNIVPIHEVGEHEGRPFLAMAMVDGAPPAPPLPAEEALRITQAIASALDCVHQAGLIHRDVKPANILLEQGGRPLLADFGLAATGASSSAGGSLSGTPQYASPEQLRGEPLDARTDVYSLGATLQHLLSGIAPYSGVPPEQILEAQRTERAFPPGVPAPLRALLRKATAFDREARYSSMADFRAALEAASGRDRSLLRNRFVLLALVLAALLSSGTTFLLLRSSRQSSDRQEALNLTREGRRLLGIAEQSMIANRGLLTPEAREALSRAKTEFYAALQLGSEELLDADAGLGRSFELQGNLERAERAYEKAAELPEARMGLARIGMRRLTSGWPGKDWKAWTLNHLSRIPGAYRSPTTELIRAFCLGQWDEALREGTRAVEQEPMDVWGHLLLGWSAREAGKLDASLRWIESARRMSGDSSAAQYQLGLTLLAQGSKVEARKALSMAVALADPTCTYLPDAVATLARLGN